MFLRIIRLVEGCRRYIVFVYRLQPPWKHKHRLITGVILPAKGIQYNPERNYLEGKTRCNTVGIPNKGKRGIPTKREHLRFQSAS